MRATLVAAILLCLAVFAQATTITYNIYGSSDCSGSVTSSVSYDSGKCTGGNGVSVSITVSGSSATYAEYNNSDCSGTAENTVTYTEGTCYGGVELTWSGSSASISAPSMAVMGVAAVAAAVRAF
jgi:hypothetical protein